MSRRASRSSFLSNLCFNHQFSRNCLIALIVGLTACLSSIALFAQQRKLPEDRETPNSVQREQEWFYRQRAYPHKHIPPGMRLKAIQQLHKMQARQRSLSRHLESQTSGTSSTSPALSTTTQAATLAPSPWTLIGPKPSITPFAYNPVSGRVTALAVDPTNSKIVYLGGAEGGVWKTTDGGQSWTPLTDNQPSLAVGSIAIDPENPQNIYVGTGEEDFSLYNYSGAGILKSTDGGSSWTQLAGPFVGPFGSESPYCGGAYIGSIAVDPSNSQVILAGADFNCSVGSGIYRSTDGGASWTEVMGTLQSPYLITGLVFDPTNSNNVYAAVGASTSSSQDGIWKSTNGGVTWTQDNGSSTAAFPASSAGRISLAIAASSPGTLYAGVASASSNSVSLLGVYKTTDGGASWTQLTSAPNYCSAISGFGQCYFDNVVAVSPTNANIVLLGGSVGSSTSGYTGTLYLSTDGGSSWKDITTDSADNAIHPDMHAIAFSSDGSTMYVGNDGGVWNTSMSSTGVGTWSDLNQSLALTQFYPGMSIDPTNPDNVFAGSQDNGTQEYSGNLDWSFIGCGDGGQTAFDYSDLNTLYISCQYVPPNTNSNGTTANFLFKLTANPQTAVAADSGINGNDNGAFIPPLTMDPSNPNILYFGTNRIYQTTDGAANWAPISFDLTSDSQGILSTVSAIAVAPSDSNTVYAGTGDGRLWVSTNATSGSAIWGSIANGTPNRSVTAIAVSPANAKTAYATFSGYSGFNGDTLGHVFETTNGGTAWTDISGNLPNVPVNDIVVDPDIPDTLYVGTDIGVFDTSDGGSTWGPLGTGLPDVVIMSLKLQHATRILRAASYGRSAWDIQLPTPTGPTAVLSTPTVDFPPQQVGTTSSALSVILTNNSSTALTVSGMKATSGFAQTNTCGTSLAAGANCTISVTFSPAALGPQTGTVTINDNAASGSNQTISLDGNGYSGAVSLSPTSLSFANQLVGTTSSAQTVTLTNSSTAPLTITSIAAPNDYQVTSDCPLSTAGSLAGGASCHISVSFAPTEMGTLAEQVMLTDSAGNSPQTIPLTGTGIQAVVTVSPTTLNFGDLVVGSKETQTATLKNTGTADLKISSISSTLQASTFSVSNNCPLSPSTIPPGGSCTITVTFAPTEWGRYSFSAGVDVSDNAVGYTQSINVSASAYSGAVTLSSTNVNFGNVAVGQTATQTVTLKNSGGQPLYILNGFAFGGDEDGNTSQTNNCPLSPASLPAGGSCKFTFSFTPSYPGGMSLFMDISDSAEGFTQTINLTGSGTGPTAQVSPSNLSFGTEGVGVMSQEQTVTVWNSGDANLTISNIALGGADPGDFAVGATSTSCSVSTPVAPNAICNIEVAFKPTATGSHSATLSITDNAASSPQTVSLSGTGAADFALAVASGTSSTVTVAPGSSADYSLTVTPAGGFNQTVSLACTGAPSLATCTVSPASVTLDGTDAQNVKVTVTTAAPGLVAPGPKGGPPGSGGFAISDWWIALLMLTGTLALALGRRRRLALLAGAFLLAAMVAGCGGGAGGGGGSTSSSPGTPSGTYTLTVTGTSASLTHSTTLKMTVQ